MSLKIALLFPSIVHSSTVSPCYLSTVVKVHFKWCLSFKFNLYIFPDFIS